MPILPAISLSAEAISNAWARLSSAHGPAISASGSALPKRAAPTATTAFAAGWTFASFIVAKPCGSAAPGSTGGLAAALEHSARPRESGDREFTTVRVLDSRLRGNERRIDHRILCHFTVENAVGCSIALLML